MVMAGVVILGAGLAAAIAIGLWHSLAGRRFEVDLREDWAGADGSAGSGPEKSDSPGEFEPGELAAG